MENQTPITLNVKPLLKEQYAGRRKQASRSTPSRFAKVKEYLVKRTRKPSDERSGY